MTTVEIAEQFEKIATLLELKEENPFRIRAFTTASRVLRSVEVPIDTFIEQLNQKQVKGFGEQLTEYTLLLYETGELPFLQELESEFSEAFLELLKLPGLGVKKLKLLQEELGVSSLEDLKEAAHSGKLETVKGFGKKTQEKLLEAAKRLEQYRAFLLYDQAERVANELSSFIASSKYCERLEIVGAIRRKCELVETIKFLASSENPEALLKHFCSVPHAQALPAEENNCSVISLENRVQASLSVVPDKDFSAALLWHTGSAQHINLLQSRAASQGLLLEEQRLFDKEQKQAVVIENEEELYSRLSLSYLEPELREGRGEIEAAQLAYKNGQVMPTLVQENDIRGIIHVHSTYSDGLNTIEELALESKQLGYSYLGISDHSQSAIYARGLSEDSVKRQHEEIDCLNEKLTPFRILKGIESDILADGSLDYPQSILETFDFVIASIHSRLSMERKEMTERILTALKNPFTSILGHPSGRLLLRREPYDIDIDAIIETAAAQNVGIELNANIKRLDLNWRHLAWAKTLGVSIPICPDAHSLAGFQAIRFGIGVARKGGLTPQDVLTCQPLERVEEFFGRRRLTG